MPELSSSQIKDVLRTPAHFYAKHMAVDKKTNAPTLNMLLGTVVHSLLLEPDRFDSEYVVSQKFDRRTKQGKADAAEFEAANAEKVVIDEAIYSEAKQITALFPVSAGINRRCIAIKLNSYPVPRECGD